MPRAKRRGSAPETVTLPVRAACRFDFAAPDELRCEVCRDHRLLLLLPERRVAMLALLLKRGQLKGRAKEETERQLGAQDIVRPQEEELSAKRKAGRAARLRRRPGVA